MNNDTYNTRNPRTQSTPVQRHTPPAQPQTSVTRVTIPPAMLYVLGFGCMAIAIIGALFGAFK